MKMPSLGLTRCTQCFVQSALPTIAPLYSFTSSPIIFRVQGLQSILGIYVPSPDVMSYNAVIDACARIGDVTRQSPRVSFSFPFVDLADICSHATLSQRVYLKVQKVGLTR